MKNKRGYHLLILYLMICLLTACGDKPSQVSLQTQPPASTEKVQTKTPKPEEDTTLNTSEEPKEEPSKTVMEFISTGNSDCILIGNKDEYMLIDGGDNDDEQTIVDKLKSKGVTHLKYIVLTHPDADHCGGLDAIVKHMEVEQIFVGNGDAQTQTYRDFIQAVMDKGLQPGVPLVESEYALGDAKIKFYNQKANDEDINDNSLVTLYIAEDCKALFMGDAGKKVEARLPLDEIGIVDVLKVGHHGSNTSTSDGFIHAIRPEYAVICCGKDNKYGHPNQEVLDTLEKYEAQIYRTDLNNDIEISVQEGQFDIQTANKQVANHQSVNDQKSPALTEETIASEAEKKTQVSSDKLAASEAPDTEVKASQARTVYVTETGDKYHTSGCQYLRKSSRPIDEDEAVEEGYTPCSRCKP